MKAAAQSPYSDNYRELVCEYGQNALEIWHYGMIFIGINLPELDGIAAVKKIRRTANKRMKRCPPRLFYGR